MDRTGRARELGSLLRAASRAYYNENANIMSDIEYDRLYDELCAIERETGIVLAGSPTQRVGYTVLGSLEKVRHELPLLSLDKTKEVEKLESFLEGGFDALISWKLDGLTVVLKYDRGELVQAVTRGNGEVGEDITHNARVFGNIPLTIKYSGPLSVRGEAIITFPDFERINEKLPPDAQYKNPRNLCSGTVRQLNSEIAAERSVNYYAFAVLGAAEADFADEKSKQLEFLSSLGFETVEHKIVDAGTVAQAVEDFREKVDKTLFATDGLVLTFNSISHSESLGTTSKFPRDSIAFKWADELAETTLLEIQWNTSRTGLINPVALFEPVELEGTTVGKASLHNVSIVEGLQLGLGDCITVYKANMIIPQIADNLSRSGTARIPELCGVCGAAAEIIQVKEGKALYCTNPDCRAKLVSSLVHFASRDALNIEGLSEATIEKFVDCGFLDDYTDLYFLDRYAEQIVNLDGFGKRSYQNLTAAIEKSKSANLANFINGLGIGRLGLSNAKQLCRHFGNDIRRIMSADEAELLEISGYGGVIAASIRQYFSNEKNIALLEKILPMFEFQVTVTQMETEAGLLAGFTFVITGDMEYYKNRKELQDTIEASGGKIASAVSAKTSYLINNDALSGSSKNKKARELGIPIITELEFRQMLMGSV